MKQIAAALLCIFFLLLAIIGALLPVIPTVPFLLAALFFAAKVPFLQRHLLNNSKFKRFRQLLADERGKPSPIFSGISIILLWVSLTITGVMIKNLLLRIFLLMIALAVTRYLLAGCCKNK